MVKRLLVIAAILMLGGSLPHAQSKGTLQGVWRVTEVTTSGPTGTTNKSPQPGLYIFTTSHYAMVRDSATTVRPAVKDAANVTPAEALATFGPFMAQAGSYTVSGTTLKTTAMVAKNAPEGGKYGGSSTYSFQVQGDTLVLTGITNLQGKIVNPTTIRLTRVE